MSFKQIFLKKEYRSFTDDIVQNFYIPLLDKAVLYQRAVGFFSSTALIEISYGLSNLLRNGGKIQLIASPRLQQEDIDAIEKGYLERNSVIEKVIFDSIIEPTNYYEEQRLNLLATLIANNSLDIKIAFIKNNKFGIYHEKVGLIHSPTNEIVAFTGSLNETATAFSYNYETVDVFCSWTEDFERVASKKLAFDSLWKNDSLGMNVINFPNVAKEKLQSYKKEYLDLEIDEKHSFKEVIKENTKKYNLIIEHINLPTIPEKFEFHDYQIEAINQWENQSFKGIFDMATGTGKTYTGLGAITRLYQRIGNNLAIFIVCPYQHLVEQWVEDIIKFNLKPIIGYSNSTQKNWKERLSNSIRDYKLKIKSKELFCFICTNATFSSDYVQSQIGKLRGDSLLVIDEAHNFGSLKLSSTLSEKFNYRLALSATLDRHQDEEGTQKLKEYFGFKCIEYTLDRAILEKKLTPYKYFPIIVNLNKNELESYRVLSLEINKCIILDNKGKKKLSEKGEKLVLKRARLVSAAKEKINKLKVVIQPYLNERFLLIYCGAASLLNEGSDYTSVNEDDIRQIDAVTNLLGNELNMKVSQFTSKENVVERDLLKKEFEKGDNLQALIAIKCLDEGVNIPKIKVAFILASTTNPKEYIQRRGRVLRLSEGKNYAEIYDFITIPRPINEVSSLTLDEMKKDLSLVKNEVTRAEEFARIALNFMEADTLIQEIKDAYNLNHNDMNN